MPNLAFRHRYPKNKITNQNEVSNTVTLFQTSTNYKFSSWSNDEIIAVLIDLYPSFWKSNNAVNVDNKLGAESRSSMEIWLENNYSAECLTHTKSSININTKEKLDKIEDWIKDWNDDAIVSIFFGFYKSSLRLFCVEHNLGYDKMYSYINRISIACSETRPHMQTWIINHVNFDQIKDAKLKYHKYDNICNIEIPFSFYCSDPIILNSWEDDDIIKVFTSLHTKPLQKFSKSNNISLPKLKNYLEYKIDFDLDVRPFIQKWLTSEYTATELSTARIS